MTAENLFSAVFISSHFFKSIFKLFNELFNSFFNTISFKIESKIIFLLERFLAISLPVRPMVAT
jgi:hypothetical protein